MIKYYIICKMYESRGGSFRYALNPKTSDLEFSFKRSEREDFIEKCNHLLKEDMYYSDIKMYYINFDKLEVVEITNEILEEMKKSI